MGCMKPPVLPGEALLPDGSASRAGIWPVKESLAMVDELGRAIEYLGSGQLDKAERICKKALELDPNRADVLHLLGVLAHQSGQRDRAVDFISKAIQNDPQNPVYHNHLGNAFLEQGRTDKAISWYRKALELKPDYIEAHYNLGNALQERGKLDEAISCYKSALALKPDYADAYNNLGSALQKQAEMDQALSCYKRALELRPDYADAYNNMGSALQELGELDGAIGCYRKALNLEPNLAQVHNNMGTALAEQGSFDEAIFYYQQALNLNPALSSVFNNMGMALQEQEKPEQAISCYQKAIELEPDCGEAYANLVSQMQRICAWENLEPLGYKLDEFTRKALDQGRRTPEHPFSNLNRHPDPALNFEVAKSWSSDIARVMAGSGIKFSFDERRSTKTRITVGYLSNDFCDHPVTHLMISLFGLHDRDKFDVFCYSYGENDGSYYRERVQRDCDKFVDVRTLGHAEAAKCIYEDQIDILVDLTGYTTNNRLSICALRPAPVQVCYLGFPGTTGAEFFDYMITDRIVTPADHAPYYSEKFVYLPHSYQINDHAQAISSKEWKRTDFDLSEGRFVFCSFNNPYKLDAVMFDTWMNILGQVPEGVLWVLPGNRIAEENLSREAEARGVKSDRLVFAEKLPKGEHLARLRLADLVLDTRIYNGHTTTSDALWAGVPVITLQGGHFASRVSASLLTAIGLPELITHSLDEYEALSVQLAGHPKKLRSIRQKLAGNRLTEPLFDTPRFVRNLEKAYREMWRIFSAGKTPRQI